MGKHTIYVTEICSKNIEIPRNNTAVSEEN